MTFDDLSEDSQRSLLRAAVRILVAHELERADPLKQEVLQDIFDTLWVSGDEIKIRRQN